MSGTTHNSLSQTVVSWCLTFAVLTAPASRNQGPGNLRQGRGQGGQGARGARGAMGGRGPGALRARPP
jgi:hypothetical protein